MGRVKSFFIGFAVVLCIVLFGFILWMRDRYVVPILTYHNVSTHLGQYSLNNVTPQAFAWQMKFLAKHHYDVISFDDYVQGIKKGTAFRKNTVVIQFDDGYEDNYTQAFPILREHHFPASIFLISDSIGLKDFMTWDQVKEMEKHGIEFGAHTRRHAYLPEISHEAAVDEIAGSKKVIEAHLWHPIKYFVYPSGGFTDDIKSIVIAAGYQAAGTTNRGRDMFNRDLFELNRIRVKSKDNALTFWAKLSGYYNVFRQSRCGEHCGKETYVVSPQ